MDLITLMFVPLQEEANIIKRTVAALWHAVAPRRADRAGAPAAAASLQIEG
jgi:hypothetical protein